MEIPNPPKKLCHGCRHGNLYEYVRLYLTPFPYGGASGVAGKEVDGCYSHIGLFHNDGRAELLAFKPLIPHFGGYYYPLTWGTPLLLQRQRSVAGNIQSAAPSTNAP